MGYTVERGRLLYKGRMVVPHTSFLMPKLFHEYHDSVIDQHGELKTEQRLASDWFWVGMRKAVQRYVQTCMVCQQEKASTTHPSGPLTVPTQVGRNHYGFGTVLVVVDRLTKFAQFVALKHPFTADKSCKDVSFEVGNWVYLKLQPYLQKSPAH